MDRKTILFVILFALLVALFASIPAFLMSQAIFSKLDKIDTEVYVRNFTESRFKGNLEASASATPSSSPKTGTKPVPVQINEGSTSGRNK